MVRKEALESRDGSPGAAPPGPDPRASSVRVSGAPIERPQRNFRAVFAGCDVEP
jgi:hypothetical protein